MQKGWLAELDLPGQRARDALCIFIAVPAFNVDIVSCLSTRQVLGYGVVV